MARIDLKNIAIFLIGLAVNALSVAVSTKAVLGLAPISTVPFIVSQATGTDLALHVFVYNMVFVVLGIMIMGRNYRAKYLWTVPVTLLFSVMCDLFVHPLSSLDATNYLVQWILVIISSILLALGLSIQLASNTVMLPVDLFVNFITVRWGLDYGKIRIVLDVTLVVTACILSFICFGKLEGVREGTIFAALAVGPLIRVFTGLMERHGFYEYAHHRTIEFDHDRTHNPRH